ncbi:MAG: diguanylate cyclase, partial [Clostridium butyricum]|nr:diguanylate cyclase [Clostridium butyricum]
MIYLNDKYESEFGVRLESVLGKRNTSIFNKELIKIYNEKIKIKMSEENVCIVKENIDGNNMMFHIIPIKDEKNCIQAFGMIVVNMGNVDKKEMNIKRQSTILRTIIDSLPESVFYKDKESRFIGINKKFKEFYNNNGIYDIIGKSDLEIYPDNKIAAEFVKIDKEIMETRKTKYYEQTIKDKFNNEIIEENVKIPVISDDGEVWGVVGLSRDITERKNLEKKLRYLSENDMLTGLYNRYSFEEKIQELNVSENLPLGIIMGDVNGLKLVNDTLGHLEGDKLLISVANVLREICSEFTKYIFRWGGDEFIILLPNAGETQ